jgi:hypothetical protein
VAPSVDQHHRDDREGGAEKHDLADRVGLAEKAHQGRHRGEQERRYQLEQDRLEDVHFRRGAPPPGPAAIGEAVN